jgi:N-acetylmuramoyl-L-alanine amidase
MNRKKTELRPLVGLLWSILAAAFVCLLPFEAYAQIKKTIEPDVKVEMVNGKDIYVISYPSKDYDLSDCAERILANHEKDARFLRGKSLRVPLAELNDEYQLEAIRTLFKQDSHSDTGWVHKVTYVSSRRQGGETLWAITEWFTGNGQNYKKLLAHNGMSGRFKLYKGTTIKIPLDMLLPAFKKPIQFEIAARRAAEAPTPESRHLNGDLTLKTDAQGQYASYRLKKGDTIYSKIVMKYTDRVEVEDVKEAVDMICRRSGIKDPRKLNAGDEIKLPLELLSVMYLPPDNADRQTYEQVKEEAEKYSNPVRSADLAGITVILDSGHGGSDPGTISRNGIYEDELVYDIMCRIKKRLETTTMARVYPTVEDRSEGYEPRDDSRFYDDSDEHVLTNPVYPNLDPKVSVNLRWYLVNSVFRKATSEGVDPNKVVFASLHADSLHPEARGTMVYIPGAYYCNGGGKSGPIYTSRAEVREDQYIEIPFKDRVRSEGLSGDLAKDLVDSLSEHGITVHPEKPVRNHVVRRGRSWAPAVIRHNIVPTKILVEVANLKNPEDCKAVSDPEFREHYAEAFVHALKLYYGGK